MNTWRNDHLNWYQGLLIHHVKKVVSAMESHHPTPTQGWFSESAHCSPQLESLMAVVAQWEKTFFLLWEVTEAKVLGNKKSLMKLLWLNWVWNKKILMKMLWLNILPLLRLLWIRECLHAQLGSNSYVYFLSMTPCQKLVVSVYIFLFLF